MNEFAVIDSIDFDSDHCDFPGLICWCRVTKCRLGHGEHHAHCEEWFCLWPLHFQGRLGSSTFSTDFKGTIFHGHHDSCLICWTLVWKTNVINPWNEGGLNVNECHSLLLQQELCIFSSIFYRTHKIMISSSCTSFWGDVYTVRKWRRNLRTKTPKCVLMKRNRETNDAFQ